MKITKTQLKKLIREDLEESLGMAGSGAADKRRKGTSEGVLDEDILDENMLKTVMDFAGPLIRDHGLDSIKGLIKMVQENPEIVQKIVSMFAK